MNDISSFKSRSEFNIIKSIVFTTDLVSSDHRCDLKITLCKDVCLPDDTIEMNCKGVSNLQIDEVGGGVSQLTRLDFEDITDRQWDGLNYYVFDYENEGISFYCKSVEFSAQAI